MSRRVWIWSSLVVVVLATTFIVLTASTDRRKLVAGAIDGIEAARGPLREPVSSAQPGVVRSNGDNSNRADPEPEPPLRADGVGRLEAPIEVPVLAELEAGLQAELNAYVDTLRGQVPIVDLNQTLVAVEVNGALVTFHYQVTMDRDFWPPREPGPVVTVFDALLCDGSICFQFRDEFVPEACHSPFAPFLHGGAAAIYDYRDVNNMPMGAMGVTDSDCSGL